ncbi:ABC transporter related protein [Pirellula staleyi DSM 6068]|uniref:ABC transporter related protein n=1 Tax=Pirellula staleyi (strain ATCC 27377 / DSM 6068 / ICPB 4128) TaxID=530564 RepID=D2QX93_PIRSD|nr:ABC transporter ATP-binding protein [Pirellula staleyi]ADB17933.1 ABC transporter related protein [Pirellula staleyi DSM 6068]
MQHFVRALRDALPYWKYLAISLLCSVGVASLWSANIATLFPILEVTLHGESLQNWNARRLTESKAAAVQLQLELDQLEASTPPADRKADYHFRRDLLATQKRAEEARAMSAQWLGPIINRWLPTSPFGTVALLIGIIVASTFLKQVLLVSSTLLVSYVSNRIVNRIRQKIFDKAMRLDRASYLQIGTSGFMSQITHATEMLTSGITSVYGGAVSEPLKIIACLLGAWCISWRLTLFSLILAPIVAVLVLYLNRQIRNISRTMLQRSKGFHHVLLEALSSMLTVQAYGREDFERDRFKLTTREMMGYAMRSAFFNSLAGPVTELLGLSMIAISLLVGGYLVINQETHIFHIRMSDTPLSISQMMVFFGMLIGASDPIRKLSGVISGVNTGTVAASMIYPLLDRESLIVEAKHPQTVARPHGLLEFKNITFGYDPADPILKGIDLTIPFGEKLAIVGPNGGGKSTLISLLCRFYDPQQGKVLLDGTPLTEMALEDLRGRLALVSQQTELFNDSVMYNIRYGRLDATDAEVVEAARKAHAHEFISAMSGGYQTVVGQNGQRLSGGQRQRIALARAILRDPEILILDEATSQIDVASESLIHDTLAEFGRSRTVIMITHRESTLDLADRIIEVSRGTIRETDALVRPAA